MKKTNREKNSAHDERQQKRVRPKQPEYDFRPLEEVVRKWVRGNE